MKKLSHGELLRMEDGKSWLVVDVNQLQFRVCYVLGNVCTFFLGSVTWDSSLVQ